MTRKLPREERVASIIDAAIAEFAEKGFEKSSMASIAKRAGITKGGIYHHFAGKEAVLAAANERVSEPVRLVLEVIADMDSAAAKLEAYIAQYLMYWADNKEKLAFTFMSIAKSMGDAELFQPYDDYISQTVAAVAEIYEQGAARGEFQSLDSRALALALCAALDGVTLYLNSGSALALEQIIESYQRIYVRGLLKGD